MKEAVRGRQSGADLKPPQAVAGGYTLNACVEAQPSVYRVGVGAPRFQVFTSIKMQFLPSVSSSWNF
jgi:hypothetical protein